MNATHPTLRRISEEIGAKPDTLRKRLERAGMPAGLDTPLTEAQIEVIFAASRPDIGRAKRTRTLRPAPAKTKAENHDNATDKTTTSVQADNNESETNSVSEQSAQRLTSAIADILLASIVVGHGALIVQELTQMAGQIGLTAGLMVAFSIVAAIVLSTNSKWFSVSGDLLWFVFMLDFAATYLHYRAFAPSLGAGLAIGLACVVSSVAFFSLYAFRSKNSNLFDGY